VVRVVNVCFLAAAIEPGALNSWWCGAGASMASMS